jgi:hypothetical protein
MNHGQPPASTEHKKTESEAKNEPRSDRSAKAREEESSGGVTTLERVEVAAKGSKEKISLLW